MRHRMQSFFKINSNTDEENSIIEERLKAGGYSKLMRPFMRLMYALRFEEGKNDRDRTMLPVKEFFEKFEGSKSADLTDEDRIIRYYEYARSEINREDDISFKRLNLTLILQGFLFTALAIVLAEAKDCHISSDDTVVCRDFIFYYFVSLTIVISGWMISYFSFRGIDASRRSLLWAKDEWIRFNRLNGNFYPSMLPQLTKRSNRHSFDHLATDAKLGLTNVELRQGHYFKNGKQRLLYKDEGWDFSLSIPVLLLVFWFVAGIAVFLQMLLVGLTSLF